MAVPSFAAYWAARSSHLPKGWELRHDPELPPGVDYAMGGTVVGVRRIPLDVEDALPVAHELEHLIQRREYPIARPLRPAVEWLSAQFNSMFLDPPANAALRGFGFDIREAVRLQYGRLDEHLLQRLEEDNRDGMDELGRLDRSFHFAWAYLNWEAAVGESGDSEPYFTVWFREHYAGPALRGRYIAGEILRMGLDTPERMAQTMSTLIFRYGLEGAIQVTLPG